MTLKKEKTNYGYRINLGGERWVEYHKDDDSVFIFDELWEGCRFVSKDIPLVIKALKLVL